MRECSFVRPVMSECLLFHTLYENKKRTISNI